MKSPIILALVINAFTRLGPIDSQEFSILQPSKRILRYIEHYIKVIVTLSKPLANTLAEGEA